jgi:serine/threonine-protein kinase
VSESVQGDSQVGKTVADKYRLLRLIGTGGMGSVYEALHVVTHRRVALKLIHAWLIESSPHAVQRFMREARAPASIGHPGIVDVLDAGQNPDGTLYLVFELLEGEDLETALSTRPVSVSEMVRIGIEVLGTLSAAHSRGFIHRDIKPANIFLAEERGGLREIKVLDFGIAKRTGAAISRITAQGSIVGTLEYMSPEQASGAVIDARSDIWGVGALLYRGIVGEPPFLESEPLELFKHILNGPIPQLADSRPELPYALCEAVDNALRREMEQRWPSANAMRSALLRCDLNDFSTDVSKLPESISGEITGERPLVEVSDPDESPTPPSQEQPAESQSSEWNDQTHRREMPTVKAPSVLMEEPTRDIAVFQLRHGSSSDIPMPQLVPPVSAASEPQERRVPTMVVREREDWFDSERSGPPEAATVVDHELSIERPMPLIAPDQPGTDRLFSPLPDPAGSFPGEDEASKPDEAPSGFVVPGTQSEPDHSETLRDDNNLRAQLPDSTATIRDPSSSHDVPQAILKLRSKSISPPAVRSQRSVVTAKSRSPGLLRVLLVIILAFAAAAILYEILLRPMIAERDSARGALEIRTDPASAVRSGSERPVRDRLPDEGRADARREQRRGQL